MTELDVIRMRTIIEPQDIWEQPDMLNEKEMKDVFVEMCFFARLGFVQPPCCLQCTYKNSKSDHSADPNCTRWVVWRKDANILLHPNQLDGNIMLVPCRQVRDLLTGNMVDGRTWNPSEKRVSEI